jgi:hypothetical protein
MWAALDNSNPPAAQLRAPLKPDNRRIEDQIAVFSTLKLPQNGPENQVI